MVHPSIPPGHLALITRIAWSVIRRLPPYLTTVADLVSVGYIGYREACERCDPARTERFETFATFRIRGAMFDELRRCDLLGHHRRYRKHMVEAMEHALTGSLGRPPTRGEIAAHLEMTERAVETIDRLPEYAELLVDHSDVNGVLAAVPDDHRSGRSPLEQCEDLELIQRIVQALPMLSIREVRVLQARYVEGLLLREIADRLGVDPSRVCQIEHEAIAKLRAACEAPAAAAA
ncbi:sigma-70 family RNA polymerase sigma factor [Candidatus Uhrbacteria bacterium]|nr:sigma-70 family RNA polymerase sigma factor [Candidatus Uhrbacteria bacterium]